MAARTGYSAGRVFLQVVPSYDNFLRTLRRDASGPLGKAIADTFEKEFGKRGYESGEGFGKEFSKGLEKRIDFDTYAKKINDGLGKAIQNVGGETTRFGRRLRDLQQDIETTGKVEERHTRTLKNLTNELIEAGHAAGDTADGHRKMEAARNLDAKSVQAYQKVLRDEARAQDDAAKAAARAERESRKGNKTTRDTARSSNIAAREVGRLRDRLSGVGPDSQAGANGFRFFNFAVLALAAAGAGLVPILGAVAGGLVAFLPILGALGAGLGVAIFGFSGLGDAVKALEDQQDATSGSSAAFQRQMVNAARAVADARRGLQDAYRRSADGIRQATERQADAERSLADAQRDAREAQLDLNEAKREAVRDAQDLENRVAQNALDERQGVIDLFNANNNYGAVMADGGSTNLEREQADIGLKQAQLNLKLIRQEQKRLREEKKKSDQDGINGAEGVKRAEDRLRDSLQRVADANRDVARATRDVTEAREDAARSVADAQRNLQRALEDQALAAQGGAESVDKVREAMEKLGPEGRAFAEFLVDVREKAGNLRRVVQAGLLPGVQEAMVTIMDTYGPGFTAFLKSTGELLGDIAVRSGEAFSNPAWQNFFSTMADSSQVFMSDFADAMLNWFEGLANILVISTPTAERMSKAMLGWSNRFKEWTASEEGRSRLQAFFDYVDRVGPKVVDFFGAFGRALGNIGVALAPIGEVILEAFTRFFDSVANMEPGKLQAIFVAIASVVVALQASQGIVAFLSILGPLLGNPILLGAVAIGALATAFFLLKDSNTGLGRTIRDVMDQLEPALDVIGRLASVVKEQIVKVWTESLLPVLEDVWKMIEEKLIPAINEFLPVIEPIVEYMMKFFFEQLGTAFEILGGIIEGAIEFFSGLLTFLTGVFTGDWEKIWDGIETMAKAPFKAVKKIARPILEGIGNAAVALVDVFRSSFATIAKLMSKPLIAFLDFVVNDGIIDGIRTIQGWLGKDESGKLGYLRFKGSKYFGNNTSPGSTVGGGPTRMASGGVLPGWSPGRDIHNFYSPTGGNLALSGGEAIMRPEFTSAMGGEEGIAKLNMLARRGLLGAMQAFAKGGVLWPTKSKHWTTYPGHDGIDLNGSGNGLGDPYVATDDGRVVYTGTGRGYGLKTELKTAGGPTVIYGHSSSIKAKEGDRVKRGQILGYIGYSGNVRPAGPAGSHLHFGLKGEPKDRGAAAIKYLAGGLFGKNFFSDVAGKIGGLADASVNILKNPEGFFKDKVLGGFRKVKGLAGEGRDMLKEIPRKLLGGIIEKLKGLISAEGVEKTFFKYTPVGVAAGLAKRFSLFDNGGYLPPGLSTVYNATGSPEPVFNPQQWEAIQRNGMGGGDAYHFHSDKADPLAAADELFRKLQAHRRRVVHSGTLGSKVGT